MDEKSAGVQIHKRSLEFETFRDGDLFRVVGRLKDIRPWANPARQIVHDMELSVEVRRTDLVIVSATATMHTFPHVECTDIEQAFAGLIGLSIGRGYTKAVSERFVGVLGCSHLEHLARSLGPAVIQSMASEVGYQVATGAVAVPQMPRSSEGGSWLRNTCHIWAEGGIGEQKLSLGAFPSDEEYPVPPVEVIIRRRQEVP